MKVQVIVTSHVVCVRVRCKFVKGIRYRIQDESSGVSNVYIRELVGFYVKYYIILGFYI